MRDWIQTLAGRKLRPRWLTADAVGDVEEIAHSLAGEFRFTRQTRQRYSVAQHVVLGSRVIAPRFAGAFLLHELSEVYLPDISGPFKPYLFVDVTSDAEAWNDDLAFRSDDGSFRSFISWETLERQHTRTVLGALRLSSVEPLIYSPEVKAMDLAMLRAEKEQLCVTPPEPWGIEGIEPAPVTIDAWSCERASAEFVTRFTELFGER